MPHCCNFHSLSARILAAPLLSCALLHASFGAEAVTTSPAMTTSNTDPVAAYKEITLPALIEQSRTAIPGQRVIFAPAPIRFQARLAVMPSPQKADYLMMALSMMKVSSPPKVSKRIGIDFGGEKPLAAYIDDTTAERLVQSARPGQRLTFYAYHVYNNNRGPALLVTSFSE